MAERSLTILDRTGDTTITWEPDQDDAMEEIIKRKMDAGVSFFIIAERKPGQRGRLPKPKKLTDPAKARAYRALKIPDEDFSKFVLEGKGRAEPTPPGSVDTVRRAKTPREAATSKTVAVQPLRGG
jgi:hypothetical protein